MSTYNITLQEDRDVQYEIECWGTEYEHKATVLKFTFPELIAGHEIGTFTKYIEFKENTKNKANEDKAIFYDVLMNDEYVLSNAITFYNSMNVQIVLKKLINEATGETVVWKSKIFTMTFCDAINASDEIDPEDPRIDLINTLVIQVKEAKEIADTLNESVSNAEVTRQTNEATRQDNEVARQTNEMARNVFEIFDPNKVYVPMNKVAYEGSSYVCIQTTTAGTLPTDENYWLLIAKKGDVGEKPESGVDYWTDEEKAEMVSEAVQLISDEIGIILDEINGEVV